jgi:hypothetical protein
MEPGLEVVEFVKKCARTRTMGFRKLKELDSNPHPEKPRPEVLFKRKNRTMLVQTCLWIAFAC